MGELCTSKITLMKVGMVLRILDVGGARYVNDIHGNTVIQDKSTGFHVFELHGFRVGVTSSIFMGIALLICATYLALKLGLGRLLRCCCSGCREVEQQTQSQTLTQPQATAPAMQATMPIEATVPGMQVARRSSASNESPGTFTVKLVP